MSEKVAVIGHLRFPAEAMPSLRASLQAFIEATRTQDGCLSYNVAEDVLEPGLLHFSETWPDHETLQAHLSAAHIQPWREASQAHGLIERKFVAFDIADQSEI